MFLHQKTSPIPALLRLVFSHSRGLIKAHSGMPFALVIQAAPPVDSWKKELERPGQWV